MSKDERKKDVIELAKALRDEGYEGSLVNTIAELTTFSQRYIQKLLPKEFKEMVKAVREGMKADELMSSTEQKTRRKTKHDTTDKEKYQSLYEKVEKSAYAGQKPTFQSLIEKAEELGLDVTLYETALETIKKTLQHSIGRRYDEIKTSLNNAYKKSVDMKKSLNTRIEAEKIRRQKVKEDLTKQAKEEITQEILQMTEEERVREAARILHVPHETPKTADTPKFPEKRYRCIVVDPPWPMEKSERRVRPDQGKYLDYATMTLEEIKKLPINDFVNSDSCHIYLWTTQRFLPDAFDMFEEWGVKYHCTLTWVKPTGMTPFSWMFNTEFVLFGWIGTFRIQKMGIKTSFQAKGREHSRKPDIFYDRVKAVSLGPRLDMFSREERDGFKPWGVEVHKFE